MNDEQPTQPLTDAELSALRDYIERTNHVDNLRRDARRLLTEVDRLRAESVRHVDCNAEAWAAAARVTRDLRAELDSITQFAESLRSERDRSVRSCGELGVELDRLRAENEQMRLEVVQMESGSQIAMNAGVAALQEVGRLEIVCDDLKLINDRMAEDRLRLVDERDRLIAERETDADVIRQIRAEATGTALGHLAKIERLQSQRDVLVRKLGLDWGPDEFGDLSKVPDCAEQINAVVSIHQPTAMNSWGHRTCTECDTPGYYQEWPCPTLVALGFEER